MSISFRYNDTTKTLPAWSTKYITPSLCYRNNGTTYYVPLLENGTSQTVDGYVYSTSGVTINCKYNNKTYKACTSRTEAYDIPAGTYSPSAFKDIIENYISPGGSRTVKYAFTVKVNNQTVNVSAGGTIFESQVSSGSNQARLVGFGYNGVGMGGMFHSAIDFANYKQYCVWCNHLGTSTLYRTYENFSITIQDGGIKFN